MKKNSAKMLICAGLCTVALCGTSVISYAKTVSEAALETTLADGVKPPQEDGSVMAKITAVGDGTITVTMAQRPERAGDGLLEGSDADGTTRPEMPSDSETPPAKPADGETPPQRPEDAQTPPEMPEGAGLPPADAENGNSSERQDKRGMMNFSSGETTVYLTDATVITKGIGNEEAALTDLSSGSIVRMILDDNQAVSIDIME